MTDSRGPTTTVEDFRLTLPAEDGCGLVGKAGTDGEVIMVGRIGGPGWRVSGGEMVAVTLLSGVAPASGSFPVVARFRLLLQGVCAPIDRVVWR